MHPTLAPPRMVVKGAKRGAGDGHAVGTPPKKAKTPPVREGVLRGRPILKDVVNAEL